MTTPTQDRELLEQALEDLCSTFGSTNIGKKNRTIAALRARLALPDAIGVGGGEVIDWPSIEKRAIKHESFGYGTLGDDGLTIHGFEPDGLKAFVSEILTAPKSGDMAQGVPETDCGNMAQGEQGRDTWKTDGGWRCVKCHKGIMEHEDQTFCKRPAARTGAEQIAELQSECASKQAKIDSLMLEYCPHEMTTEQTAEWAKHQKPAAAQPKGDGNG